MQLSDEDLQKIADRYGLYTEADMQQVISKLEKLTRDYGRMYREKNEEIEKLRFQVKN